MTEIQKGEELKTEKQFDTVFYSEKFLLLRQSPFETSVANIVLTLSLWFFTFMLRSRDSFYHLLNSILGLIASVILLNLDLQNFTVTLFQCQKGRFEVNRWTLHLKRLRVKLLKSYF